MSDDNGFPAIHIDFVANGDFIHLRTNSGVEMAEAVDSFSTNADTIFKGIGDIKQAALVHGVFSGSAAAGATGSSAPASSGGSTPPGQIPKCPTHGEMNDLRGKRNKQGEPLKNRYYCKKFGCKDVSAQGDWIE